MIEINLTKLERGTKKEWKTVTRGGKTFKQRFATGKKDDESTCMVPGNVQSISTLREAGVEGGYHKKDSYIVNFKDGSHGFYKTSVRGAIYSEVSVYKINKIIGWDLVPETVKGDFGKGLGSVQKWVEGGKEPYTGNFYESRGHLTEKHLDDLSKIYLMDTALGIGDRNSRNAIVKDDRIHMIDNDDFGINNFAEKHLNKLDDYIDNETPSHYSSMLSWMNASDIDDVCKKLKVHILNNIEDILDKEDEIIEYYNLSKDLDLESEFGIPIKDAIKNIKENLEYMSNYYDKNKGI